MNPRLKRSITIFLRINIVLALILLIDSVTRLEPVSFGRVAPAIFLVLLLALFRQNDESNSGKRDF